uniref:Phycoerythrobilin:Cys-82 alpha-phycoerythrin lyase, CpeZ subunit n=1 Tax=uncultured Synechococcus sp. TaxID=154535 RepID=A0A024CGL5_9SYNE|nr:phycoerythrobilin:Cys-82 alpha-phycoerythrin lyase, CpeZ subunit [uncultured Synechococcus sp.]
MSSIISLDDLFLDLSHPNPNIRMDACVVMSENYFDEAFPRLLDLLNDSDPTVYRTAVKGLGVFGHRVLSPLLDLFNTTDNSTVKACCIKAFVQVSVNFPESVFPEQAITALKLALDDPNPVVSQSALMTLGYFSKQEHEKERVIPMLVQVCNSANIAHVQSAVMSLAEVESTQVDKCFASMINTDSTDPLIKEILESSMSRRQSLFGS